MDPKKPLEILQTVPINGRLQAACVNSGILVTVHDQKSDKFLGEKGSIPLLTTYVKDLGKFLFSVRKNHESYSLAPLDLLSVLFPPINFFEKDPANFVLTKLNFAKINMEMPKKCGWTDGHLL